MTVHSWVVGATRLVAKFYFWFLAIFLGIFGLLVIEKIGVALFGDPSSYVFTLGWDHPPLAGSARMIEDSPLVVGHDSPRLGSVLAELQQILPAVYPAVIIGLALRALDRARDEGTFSDGLPRRLAWLGWALIAQPAWALFVALCIAYLRVQVLAGSTFGDEVNSAFTGSLAWPAVGAGVGVLVLRSIIIEGIGLRRDLDGTV
ncbi:DUF2975 domain-containing protein [Pseudonocardia endophytica]|uniref:DUF2975 family protein n=1 Tax=Pseudonocardia endophytica TaxID=401976 RepID=A0A4R1HMC3_PSEEN|nr:DUF2975 domain-containing protein [Pseudonocardia endophytica]TCK22183.1 DUF2975 family protein [Pseudonocardia endophytica]